MCWTHILTQTHTQRVCYTLQSNTDREPVCFPSVSLFQSTELFSFVSAGGISLSLNWFVTVPLPFWSPWHKNTNVFLQQNFFLVIFGQVCVKTVGSFCNKHDLIGSFWILLQSYSSILWIQFKIQSFLTGVEETWKVMYRVQCCYNIYLIQAHVKYVFLLIRAYNCVFLLVEDH